MYPNILPPTPILTCLQQQPYEVWEHEGIRFHRRFLPNKEGTLKEGSPSVEILDANHEVRLRYYGDVHPSRGLEDLTRYRLLHTGKYLFAGKTEAGGCWYLLVSPSPVSVKLGFQDPENPSDIRFSPLHPEDLYRHAEGKYDAFNPMLIGDAGHIPLSRRDLPALKDAMLAIRALCPEIKGALTRIPEDLREGIRQAIYKIDEDPETKNTGYHNAACTWLCNLRADSTVFIHPVMMTLFPRILDYLPETAKTDGKRLYQKLRRDF